MSEPFEFPIGEVELVYQIKTVMADGKKRLVDDIIQDLRNQNIKFNNENVTEAIANLDGILIQRTSDGNKKSVEYIQISEKDIDQDKLKEILYQAMQSQVDNTVLMMKQAFFLELAEKIHKIQTLDVDEQRQVELDVALFSVMTSKELDKDNSLVDESKNEPHPKSHSLRNTKTVMLSMERELKTLYLKTKNNLAIQKQIKKFAKMSEVYLQQEYQKRMMVYVPEYNDLVNS
jgi:hypothetical protein